ncbi:MAG: hypothetical protein IPO17_14265 [Flavobacteriales bacterium]|nr:hypothetical protein [Flavobacteriales bacterium]
MNRSVLLFVCCIATSTAANAQRHQTGYRGGPVTGNTYCVPDFVTGTAAGDYIDGVVLGTLSNIETGDSAGAEFTDYYFYGTGFTTRLLTGSAQNLTITSGGYQSDWFTAWIDFDRDNVFEPSEMLGQFQTQTPAETQSINFNVPFDVRPGYTGMRVMCSFNNPAVPDPCAVGYNWGEVEDYAVLLDNGAPCIPLTSAGTVDGDFMSLVGLNGMTDATGLQGKLPYSLPTRAAHVEAGQTYPLSVVTGDYDNDRVGVWVDWNDDAVFDDPAEYIGGFLATSSFFQGQIQLPVPADAWGWKRMRVICADELVLTPCDDFFYGETRDYVLVIDHPLLPCLTYNYAGEPSNYGIASVSVGGSTMAVAGGAPNHLIAGLDPAVSLQPGQSIDVTIGAGALAVGRYQAFFDKNGDLDFDDVDESIGSQFSSMPNQTIIFPYTIPASTTSGGHFLRVAAFGPQVGTQPACTDPTIGQVYDLMVTVDAQGAPCIPALSSWTIYGDFIDGVELGSIVNTGTGGQFAPLYTDYSAQATDLILGDPYTLTITSGEYDDDLFSAWIDYNGDGDWSDANELLGTVANTTPYQVLALNFMVPTGIPLGPRAMRVRCEYNVTPDPCADGIYGETEDYSVNLNSSTAVRPISDGDIQVIARGGQVEVMLAEALVGSSVQLLDATGKLLHSGIVLATRMLIPLAGAAQGSYVLHVQGTTAVLSKRFVLAD